MRYGGFVWRAFDINTPVLKMLEIAKEVEEAFTAFNSYRLAEDVEFYAPRYLAMEVEGRAVEYDLAPLTEGFEVYYSNH
ncbi:hypothetical protein PENFLA_c019G06780 [Penicillium flavigenum]|uniref:Uncharacterized protein n=1 Tax=Penicillium flavigenum TaxID=254877 RepID=A0A1V6SYZ1_9EURO|nr:hypothetical protein PENFLA_c019G06780 [Penicillium flavigenum]